MTPADAVGRGGFEGLLDRVKFTMLNALLAAHGTTEFTDEHLTVSLKVNDLRALLARLDAAEAGAPVVTITREMARGAAAEFAAQIGEPLPAFSAEEASEWQHVIAEGLRCGGYKYAINAALDRAKEEG